MFNRRTLLKHLSISPLSLFFLPKIASANNLDIKDVKEFKLTKKIVSVDVETIYECPGYTIGPNIVRGNSVNNIVVDFSGTFPTYHILVTYDDQSQETYTSDERHVCTSEQVAFMGHTKQNHHNIQTAFWHDKNLIIIPNDEHTVCYRNCKKVSNEPHNCWNSHI